MLKCNTLGPAAGLTPPLGGNVHITDLSNLIVAIVGKAQDDDANPELWNENGLYTVQTGEMVCKCMARLILGKPLLK